MPSSGEGYRLVSEHPTRFPANPGVWSYGMPMPWQASHQLAYPIPFHIVAPQLNSQWFAAVENFASLPPKPKKDKDCTSTSQNARPSRRFSDPGPNTKEIRDSKPANTTSQKSKMFIPSDEEWNYSEDHHFIGK